MSLEDTLRQAERFPPCWYPEHHTSPEPQLDPNWRWVELWEVENPNPGGSDNEAWASWYAERRKMHDRVWVASCMPQFRVFDWPDEDVQLARRLVARHVCGVCGRSDDPGCGLGC